MVCDSSGGDWNNGEEDAAEGEPAGTALIEMYTQATNGARAALIAYLKSQGTL